MKQTKNYLLNLMEAADALSAKPLNENAEKIEAALLAQQNAIVGKLMMATGTYTGNGTRSVTIQTPGFKPEVVLVRYRTTTSGWSDAFRESWWSGNNVKVSYGVYARSDTVSGGYDAGELRRDTITDNIRFTASNGSLEWKIYAIDGEYYDIREDGGPSAMNNENGTTYEWVAFGTAEE